MSRTSNGKILCPFCLRKEKKTFIVGPGGGGLGVGAYCPKCSAEVVDINDGGKLYVVEDGKRYVKDPDSVEKIAVEDIPKEE